MVGAWVLSSLVVHVAQLILPPPWTLPSFFIPASLQVSSLPAYSPSTPSWGSRLPQLAISCFVLYFFVVISLFIHLLLIIYLFIFVSIICILFHLVSQSGGAHLGSGWVPLTSSVFCLIKVYYFHYLTRPLFIHSFWLLSSFIYLFFLFSLSSLRLVG